MDGVIEPVMVHFDDLDAAIGPELRAASRPLQRAASQGLDARAD